MPERLSQNKTRQQKLLCVSACCISNVLGFIYGLLLKNCECLLLNLMKPETLKGIYPEFQVIRGFSQKIPADLLSYDKIHS